MMKTNLTPSPRLIGQWCCCCFKDFLYNKATLILMIFMLPLAGFAQQSQQMTKAREAQHQEYLQSIYGNKAEPQQMQSDREVQELNATDKSKQLEELHYQELLLEYGINEQKYLDNGLSKEDILAEIEALQAAPTTKGNNNIQARLGGGDYCSEAVVLQCGEPIIGDNFGGFTSDVPAPTCGSFYGDNGVWFTLTGNNDFNTISLTAFSGFSPVVNVYSSGDGTCNSLQCISGGGNGSTSVNFFAAGGLTYYVVVGGEFGFEQGTFTILRDGGAEPCVDTPPGDGLAPESAFPIACGDIASGDTTGFPASNTTQAGCGPSANPSPAVWYTFTATAGTPEDITFTTCGYDTRMAIWSGSPGSLVCVGGNDDSTTSFCPTNSFESEFTFTADIDVTYYIKVWAWSSFNTGSAYDLRMVCDGDAVTPPPAAPNNDLCPDAQEIICGETLTNQTTVAANVENTDTCGFSIGPDVWYSFDGTGDQTIISVTPSGGTAEVEVYESTGGCNGFTIGNCLANDTFTSSGSTLDLGFPTNQNNVYYVRVAVSTPTGNEFDFDISLDCPQPLENDDCDGAFDLLCGDSITGSTVTATPSNPPVCADLSTDFNNNPGVWYRHVGTGLLTDIDLSGSNYDTKIGLYTGDCEGGLVCVTGDDDGGDGLDSRIQITTVLNQEYFLFVSGFGDGSVGTYLINVTCQVDPCTEAEDIACGETATGTTIGGSTAGPEDTCGTSPGATGVFYRFVGTDQFVTASLCNSSYDTKINVYQGDCGALTCVGGNDDSCGSRSEFTWYGGVGEVYYIWVSGFSTATGDYELTMTCNAPVSNDLCEDAPRLSCDVTIEGSTSFATDRDRPDSDCSEYSQTIGEGVWYTLAGTGGDIRLSLCDSDFDTKILVFTGECGDDLECYAGNDDNFAACGSGFRSELTMPTTAGEIYTIYITGYTYSGGPQTGDFTLEVDCLCAPSQSGPECVTIYDGYDDPAYSTGTLTGVLDYAEEPVSYAWSTGETTQSITVDAADGSGNYSVTMTDAEGCTGSQEFFVYVMDINCDTRGTDKVEICHNGTTICVSPNAVQAHLQHGDVLGACGNALCDEVAPLCDLTITSPANGATDASNFPVIEWTEASGLVDGYTVSIVDENGVEVVNADAGNALSYVVGTDLGYLADYTVSVSPYNANGNALGCPVNSFRTISEPSGDGFTPQTALSVSCAVQGSGETPNPNSDDSAASFCGTSSGIANGSWFTFVGTGGTMNINTVGSFADTKLQVYSSNDGGDTLSCVGGDDDISFPSVLQSEVVFSSTLGQQYFAYVSSYDSTSYPSGPFVLNVDCNVGGRPGDIKGGSQNSTVDWALAPNPTRGNVTLNLGKYMEESVNIDVIDFTGKVISTITIDNLRTPTYNLELSSSLPSGLYFVRVSSDLRNSTKKLMIMR